MCLNKKHSYLIYNYNENIIQLSNIIFDWNLTNSLSKSDLYRFAEKILNSLIEEQEVSKIQKIIESELCMDYILVNLTQKN